MPVGTALARIMHHASRFCPPSPRHAFDPSSLWNALGIDLPGWWLVAPWLRDRMASGRSAAARNHAPSRQPVGNWTRMRAICDYSGKLIVPALDDALRLGPGGTVGNLPLRVDHNVEATRPHAHRRSIRRVEPTIQPMGARCAVLDPPHAQNPDPVLILTEKSAALKPRAELETAKNGCWYVCSVPPAGTHPRVEAPKPRLSCLLVGALV